MAELLHWIWPRRVFHEIGAFNLHLGTPGIFAAMAAGWALAATMGMEEEFKTTLAWHRWLGTGCAVWAALAVALWHIHSHRQTRGSQLAYRVVLFSEVMLVGLVGHLGGMLVYGLNYYTW